MRTFTAILLVSWVTACASFVTKDDLLVRMATRKAMDDSHINILWYRGTKDHSHHLSHVYAMFGSKDYIVSDSELVIPAVEVMPLTSDSTKWRRIASIGKEWEASRKDFQSGLWKPEPEGMSLGQ